MSEYFKEKQILKCAYSAFKATQIQSQVYDDNMCYMKLRQIMTLAPFGSAIYHKMENTPLKHYQQTKNSAADSTLP